MMFRCLDGGVCIGLIRFDILPSVLNWVRGRHCHLSGRCGGHCWTVADAAAVAAEFDFAFAEAVAGDAALAAAADAVVALVAAEFDWPAVGSAAGELAAALPRSAAAALQIAPAAAGSEAAAETWPELSSAPQFVAAAASPHLQSA